MEHHILVNPHKAQMKGLTSKQKDNINPDSPWDAESNFLGADVSRWLTFNAVLQEAPSTLDENLNLMTHFPESVCEKIAKLSFKGVYS